MGALDVLPETLTGTLIVGDGRTWTYISTGADWPASTRLRVEDHAGVEQVLTPGIAGTLATWTLTVAEAAALRGTKTSGSLHARITTGTGDALRPWAAGRISIVSAYVGSSAAQSLGTVTVGPEGPTAVSADAGNNASLGTDGLIYVSPTAGAAHVIKDEGVALTNRAALNFAGAGVTVTDDAGNGATLVTIPSGGATTLDGLTDVSTAGQAAGKALVSDGTNWAPSSAAVILEGDTRLTDPRTPAAHNHDDRYYTESEIEFRLLGFAEFGHNHSGVYAPVLGSDDNYVTDAEKVKLANLSGTNSGDQDLSGLVPKSLVDAKGDLLVGSADNTVVRLPAGTTGQALLVDPAEASGLKWGSAGGAGPQQFTTYRANALIANAANTQNITPRALSANVLYLTAIRLWADASIVSASFRVTTAGAGVTLTPVLYALRAGNYPATQLAAFPAVSGASTGTVTSTLGAAVAVPAGVYLVGIIASGAVSIASTSSRYMQPPLWGEIVSGGDAGSWQYVAISKESISIPPPADLSSETPWTLNDPNSGGATAPTLWLGVA